MADLLPFPPPVTGERRRPGGSVSLDAYNVVLDQHAETWRALIEANDMLEDAECEIRRLRAEQTSERRRGPSRYAIYALCVAVGLFVGHLLTRAGL